MNNKNVSLILIWFLSMTANGGEFLRKAERRNIPLTNYVTSVSGKIIAIGMERVTDLAVNGGPGYCVVFHDDGTVKYEGIAEVEKKGRFKAKVGPEAFYRLVGFVRDNDMLKMPDRARPHMTDSRQYVIYIRTDTGEKLIHDPNFPDYANPKVVELGKIIDELLSKIELKPDK